MFITPAHRCRKSIVSRAAPGFTLLEVILSLVVLAAGLAIFGEVMRLADRNAADARAETQAQLLAASVMDEILAGALDDRPATRQPLDVADETPWVYSVAIGTSDVQGIVPVEVLVEQDVEPQFNPVKFRLLRWVATAEEESTEESDESASGSSTGGARGAAGAGSGAAGAGGATL